MITIKRLPIAFLVGAALIAAACSGGTGNLGTVPPVPTASASVDPGPDLTPEPSGTSVRGSELGTLVQAE